MHFNGFVNFNYIRSKNILDILYILLYLAFSICTLKASTHLGSKRSKRSKGSNGSDGSNGSKRSMMRVYSLGRQLAPFEPFEPFRG